MSIVTFIKTQIVTLRLRKKALKKLKSGRQLHTGERCTCGAWVPLVWSSHLGLGKQSLCTHFNSGFTALQNTDLDKYLQNRYFQKRWGVLL